MTSIKDITKILSFLAALYPRFQLSGDTIRAYATVLEDVDTDSLQAAAVALGSESRFFPTASELRQRAFDINASDSDRMTGEEAWGEVTTAMHNHGFRYKEIPGWSNPNIIKAIRSTGGWTNLCLSQTPAADRARFINAFDTFQSRREEERRMLPAVRDAVSLNRQIEAVSDTDRSLHQELEHLIEDTVLNAKDDTLH